MRMGQFSSMLIPALLTFGAVQSITPELEAAWNTFLQQASLGSIVGVLEYAARGVCDEAGVLALRKSMTLRQVDGLFQLPLSIEQRHAVVRLVCMYSVNGDSIDITHQLWMNVLRFLWPEQQQQQQQQQQTWAAFLADVQACCGSVCGARVLAEWGRKQGDANVPNIPKVAVVDWMLAGPGE
jgi:hypothetical protein